MKNAFGLEIHRIRDLFQDTEVEREIYRGLLSAFGRLGISGTTSEKLAGYCVEMAKAHSRVFDYERDAHGILEQEGLLQQIKNKLGERSRLEYEQIKPYAAEGSILDLGCGDGKVGGMFAENHKVFLSDIYEDSGIKNTGLEFRLCQQGRALPFDSGSFDNTLLLTVLHHSKYPHKTLEETKRVGKPGGRALIIESVVGLARKEVPYSEKTKGFFSLSPEQQMMVTSFFDHLHNRIIYYEKNPRKKRSVPLNFNTMSGWKGILEKIGLRQKEIVHLGFDQPTALEYHLLYVCDL